MKLSIIFHNININYGDGGTEKYIRNQINKYNKSNINCVVIFQLTRNYKLIEFDYFGFMYNFKFIGFTNKTEIMKWINKIKNNGIQICDVYIHHLRDFNILSLISIIKVIGKTQYYFYVHDYYSTCIQYNLLKNGKSFCGDANLDKEKCSDCKYYLESIENKRRIYDLLLLIKKDLKVIIPSEFTKNMWCSAYPEFIECVLIIPHLKLEGKYLENRKYLGNTDCVKIAFVGGQAYNKGWENWKIASDILLAKKCKLKLYYFGSAKDNRMGIENVYVSIAKMGGDAMMNELRRHNIDCVVLFSCVPETYSYTYYESFAANTFIITNYDSGNIANLVQKNKNGIIIENNVNALVKFLSDSKQLISLINSFRSKNIYGPLKLINNFSKIFEYEQDNKKIKFPIFPISIKRLLWELIYRIKYYNYINIIRKKEDEK